MNPYREDLRSLWFGMLLCLATLLGGFGLGVIFGAGDKPLREALTETSAASIAETPGAPFPNADARVEKAWTFLRRSHLHANGMATTGIILIALTPLLGIARRSQQAIAACLGLGGAGYSVFLVVARIRTTHMGDPSLVKESLRWLAMPAAGIYAVATLVFTICVARWAITGKNGERGQRVVVTAKGVPGGRRLEPATR
ncbi:MAG: hypothetical protein QM783_14340 [Phycisphaerales bacterium]